MAIEQLMLLINSGVLLFIVIFQGLLTDATMGIKYAMGNRHEKVKDTPLMGRVIRLRNNQIENLVIFISLVVISSTANISNNSTIYGAQIFTISRVVYAILYLVGVKVLRSIIWTIGLIGIFIMSYGLFLSR